MRTISAHGAEIPVLGIGTWQLSGRQAAEVVAEGLRLGYRHVDTARMYGNEAEVGAGIRESGVDRDEVFLTTKIWPDDFRRDDLRRAAEDSVRTLGVDRVDLMLLHWPAPDVPLAETVDALSGVVEDGLARFAGVSNFNIRLVEEARAAARVPLVCNQVEFHPFIEQEKLRRWLEDQGMALVAYAPLGKGQIANNEVLARIGARHHASPAQVALAWELSHLNVAAIPKSARPERLAENLRALEIELSHEERAEIAGLTSRDGRMIELEGYAPDWD